MKRQLIPISVIALLATPGLSQAQDKREQMKEKREEMREKRKDKRDERKDKRNEKREDRKDKRDEMREDRKDKRDDRKEAREDRRDDRKEARGDRRDERKDARADRKDARKERRERVRDRWQERRKKVLVTGYTPSDKKVVIRGANFPKDAVVTVGGKSIKATIAASSIQFDATVFGRIVVKAGGQEFVVGTYADKDVVSKNARKARRAERNKAARARVKARWAKRQKTREARRAAYKEEREQAAATRAARAKKRAEALRAKFEREFIASEPVQTELSLHAARRARLVRMRRLAEVDDREKLSIRIEVLIEREGERHERRMNVLRTNFKG